MKPLFRNRILGWLVCFTRGLHRRALLWQLESVEHRIFRRRGAAWDQKLSLELDAVIIALEALDS